MSFGVLQIVLAENLRYWSCCKRIGGLGISASSSLDKTNPRTRIGLLATGPQAQLTRSVNEEALECASREAISRVLTLPPSRFGLLAKPPGRRPNTVIRPIESLTLFQLLEHLAVVNLPDPQDTVLPARKCQRNLASDQRAINRFARPTQYANLASVARIMDPNLSIR